MYLFGAHVVRWVALGAERIWLSPLAAMDGSGPIRGGVPLAWPQFADQGTLDLHGFARTSMWEVEEVEKPTDGSTRVALGLRVSKDERWQKPFALRYTVALSPRSLCMELKVSNPAGEPLSFSSCLHTYLAVKARDTIVRGLKGLTFRDKADSSKTKEETSDVFRPEAAAAESSFIDRVYNNAPDEVEVIDSASATKLTVKKGGFMDVVIFNPWTGKKVPDIPEDAYESMLCVEAAVASCVVTVPPGETWTGHQLIEVDRM
eukprot:Sspe_Gene.105168::Locus_82208_Transcript_1_1_Confidence_1.000_Length_908::g.105168::m.105168/K01792/E5.1.3.15; glucose-6-phosphate 1-epimerase